MSTVQETLVLLHFPEPPLNPQVALDAQTVVVLWQYFKPVQSELVVHCLLVSMLHVP